MQIDFNLIISNWDIIEQGLFFKDEFFLTCHKKYLYESFPTQIKQISRQFRLYVTDTHSRKHGFIF